MWIRQFFVWLGTFAVDALKGGPSTGRGIALMATTALVISYLLFALSVLVIIFFDHELHILDRVPVQVTLQQLLDYLVDAGWALVTIVSLVFGVTKVFEKKGGKDAKASPADDIAGVP